VKSLQSPIRHLQIESSFDTVESYQIGTTVPLNATGSYSGAVTSSIGPMVGLVIENRETFAVAGLVSVWLQAKTT
jgi:hypothetical protein